MRNSRIKLSPSLAFLCLFSGLWTSGFAGVPANGALVFEEGFESGVYALKNSGNAPEVVKVPDARAGSHVLKSQINPTRENKYRTETSLNVGGLNFEVGQEYWVGMSVKLGEDFNKKKFDDQGMLMQWHYRDWKYPKALGSPQPLLLRYVGKGRVIVDSEVVGREGTGSRTLAKIKVPVGEWVDWVFHYKLDDKDGIIQIWRNGELVVDWTGDNHQVEKSDGAYLKFGLYSAQFRPKKSPRETWKTTMPAGASRTVYHDEVRIAGADGSYELVAPRGD
jgi:hypothetical protein